MQFDGFEWDGGNREKCRRHGVELDAIEFALRNAIFAPDLTHSVVERRYLAAGRSRDGRAVFVVFTLRKHGALVVARPISARYMHAKEARRYGRQTDH